jgi:hypothetical protein
MFESAIVSFFDEPTNTMSSNAVPDGVADGVLEIVDEGVELILGVLDGVDEGVELMLGVELILGVLDGVELGVEDPPAVNSKAPMSQGLDLAVPMISSE